MEPHAQQEKLMLFCNSLPFAVVEALGAKNLDILLTLSGIYTPHEFVLYETGNICEGVLKVLKGEDSPSNLLAFIEKDERIEEDNRPKIPEIAYEIQTKIFDPVLPILKQAGFPIKEGRVPQPAPKPIPSPYVAEPAETSQTQSARIPAPTLPGAGASTSPAIDEKNIRALIKIASGTSYTEEQLKDAFLSLPPGLRQSLSSVDTANAIQDIAKRYLLHVDQMAELASETGLVLLGLTHPADFIKNLSRRLRLPEEKAREIARDISAQILIKVREGLRNLHEEKPASSFQVQGSSQKKVEMAKNPTISNLPGSSAGLKARSYPLEASSTPYSAGAKWNTGENILAKQVGGERSLNRAEVLRDIENPQATKRDSYLGTKSYEPPTISHYSAPMPPKATLVGPTGWKPGGNEGRSMKYEVGSGSAPQELPIATVIPSQVPAPTPPRNEVPRQTLQGQSLVGQGSMQGSRRLNYEVGRNSTERSVPTTPAQKARPQSEVATPIPAPQAPPQDFLDQKLQSSVTIPREEKRYTTDPYREPLA